MMDVNFDIDGVTGRDGQFVEGFYRPKITREVLKQIGSLRYLQVSDKGLTMNLEYKGEKVFELFKNLFYGRAYYGDFYVGGDIPVETVYVGDNLGPGEFEREINLYKKTEEGLEEKYEKNLEEFEKKMREIEERARQAIIDDLKNLDFGEVYRDFTVFVNAKTATSP